MTVLARSSSTAADRTRDAAGATSIVTPEIQAALAADLAKAAGGDDETSFPYATFALLHQRGLMRASGAGGAIRPMLGLLAAVGRGDLATGRIFEGHVNALDLIARFGTPAQAAAARRDADDGHVFAVWNTDIPDRPLVLEKTGAGMLLKGGKTFASGVDAVTRALVTATDEHGGRLLLLLPLDPPHERIDRSWWRPMGMRSSVSHVIELGDRAVADDQVVGRPDDYLRQPWFGAGAIRFAAVQVGGMHALLDAARSHLVGAGRAEAPYQLHRLARMAIAVEGGYGWLERAAAAWDRGCTEGSAPAAATAAVAQANLTRSAVEALAMTVIDIAQQAVGCAGLIEPHPLERRLRDLMVYLRQPNPDGALAQAGQAVANGTWEPHTW